jgi:hypothetical protein
MFVPGARLPTQRALPDCFGFLGGPLDVVDFDGRDAESKNHSMN